MFPTLATRVVYLSAGFAYPAYASFKCLKTDQINEMKPWIVYWISMGTVTCIEVLTDTFLSWIPFYNEMKLGFVFWLILPQTRGSFYLFNRFIKPNLEENEKQIDSSLVLFLNKLKVASIKASTKVLGLLQEALTSTINTNINNSIKSESEDSSDDFVNVKPVDQKQTQLKTLTSLIKNLKKEKSEILNKIELETDQIIKKEKIIKAEMISKALKQSEKELADIQGFSFSNFFRSQE